MMRIRDFITGIKYLPLAAFDYYPPQSSFIYKKRQLSSKDRRQFEEKILLQQFFSEPPESFLEPCKMCFFRLSNSELINNSATNLLSTFTSRPVFPFTSIIGQEEMKLALILNVIDPRIGGVMVMGDRGTGKSTTIRALIDVLPIIKVVKNDQP